MSERDSDWPPGTHTTHADAPADRPSPSPGSARDGGCGDLRSRRRRDVGRSGGGSRAPAAAPAAVCAALSGGRVPGGGASPLQGRECRVVPRRPRPADRSAAARTGASNPNPSPGVFLPVPVPGCAVHVSAVPVWPHRRPLRICRERPRAFISPTAFEHAFEQAPRAGRRGGALGAGGGRVGLGSGLLGAASSESAAGSGRLRACGCS